MAKFKPLFPEESMRTRQFRKVIIRKTLQIARKHPNWTDEEISALVEAEAVSLCDLCVETSFSEKPELVVGQHFTDDVRDQRQDHVGRFFVHKIQNQFRADKLTNNLIPIFSQSVISLLGHDVHESYSNRLKELISHMTQEGVSYEGIVESEPAELIMREIMDVYIHEMNRTSSFEALLKNKLDAELARYQADHQDKHIDIVSAVNQIYGDFLEAIGVNNGSGKIVSADRGKFQGV